MIVPAPTRVSSIPSLAVVMGSSSTARRAARDCRAILAQQDRLLQMGVAVVLAVAAVPGRSRRPQSLAGQASPVQNCWRRPGKTATYRPNEALQCRRTIALGADRRRSMKGEVEALLFDLGRVVIDLDATRAL